jgi:hypothetical protein
MVQTITGVSAGAGTASPQQRRLCVIGCAAPPVLQVGEVVDAARSDGWDTGLVLTPTAGRWLADQLSDLARRAGHPVRIASPRPGETPQPRADAVLVTPATSNSLNKCAAGISDTLALGLMNEAIGRNLPIIAVACVSHDLAHPAFPATVATLRGAGVELIGADRPATSPFPWREGLDRIAQLWQRRFVPGPPLDPLPAA